MRQVMVIVTDVGRHPLTRYAATVYPVVGYLGGRPMINIGVPLAVSQGATPEEAEENLSTWCERSDWDIVTHAGEHVSWTRKERRTMPDGHLKVRRFTPGDATLYTVCWADLGERGFFFGLGQGQGGLGSWVFPKGGHHDPSYVQEKLDPTGRWGQVTSMTACRVLSYLTGQSEPAYLAERPAYRRWTAGWEAQLAPDAPEVTP